MGNINIDKNHMTVEVNSKKRSKTIQKEIKKRLRKKAVYKSAEIASVEEYLNEREMGDLKTWKG